VFPPLKPPHQNPACTSPVSIRATCPDHQILLYFIIRMMKIDIRVYVYTGWHTKCHTVDCARNTFLLLQKHLTSGTELILIGWKIVPNEEPFCFTTSCKRTLAFVTTFRHKSSERAWHNFTMWALSCATFSGLLVYVYIYIYIYICIRLYTYICIKTYILF